MAAEGYHLETLDVNDQPIDVNGAPLGANYADRYYGPNDEIKAYHEGINYGQPYNDMPGLDISHYNTDDYDDGLATIAAAPTNQPDHRVLPARFRQLRQPRDGGSTAFTRHVYENQTFTDSLLPVNRHALFRNCTFEGVLYVDAYKTNTNKAYTNNVRFENCTFNGVIVTDVPQTPSTGKTTACTSPGRPPSTTSPPSRRRRFWRRISTSTWATRTPSKARTTC